MMQPMQFFLGGVSATGFRSRFSARLQAPDTYTYILKGGPGTGKSTLMKRLAAAFPDEAVSLYSCASDPGSLDAVALEERGVIVVDGTAPHVMEAAYPLVSQEIRDLAVHLKKADLQAHAAEIRECFQENAQYHQRTRQYVQAIASLHHDMITIGSHALLCEKLSGFCERLQRRYLPKGSTAKGKLRFEQLSALTTEGYVTKPLPDGYRVVLVRDPLFAASDFLLRRLAEEAISRGFSCSVSECFLQEEPLFEHLLIPELNLAFLGSTPCTHLALEPEATVNCLRFYDRERTALKKQRISFDGKACRSLMEEAAHTLQTALEVHDQLETYYIGVLDFTGLDAELETILSEIRSKTTAPEPKTS